MKKKKSRHKADELQAMIRWGERVYSDPLISGGKKQYNMLRKWKDELRKLVKNKASVDR